MTFNKGPGECARGKERKCWLAASKEGGRSGRGAFRGGRRCVILVVARMEVEEASSGAGEAGVGAEAGFEGGGGALGDALDSLGDEKGLEARLGLGGAGRGRQGSC